MKLPKKIKIGQMQYVVCSMAADGNWGMHEFGRAKISLDDDIVEEAVPFTLWHEIIHALLGQAGYRSTTLSDEERCIMEKIVCALPFGIVQILRDNPTMREL